MVNVVARLKVKGKNFEILVDVDKALQLKNGKPVSMQNVLPVDRIFSDNKKGMQASEADLKAAFDTSDVSAIAEKIIKSGEIQIPQEYRAKEREDKIKQVIDFLARNALDPLTKKPHTPDRIKSALESAGVNIENKPVEEQIGKILEKLRAILPIKLETKKLSVKVPAIHTGKVYGLLQDYKEKEEWMSNGDLVCIINLPVGMQISFYDKLNSITHGSTIVEEIKS